MRADSAQWGRRDWGYRRWQLEVRAEQFSTVGVEGQRGLGIEGGTIIKVIVFCPRPGPWPLSSVIFLSVIPNKKHLLRGVLSVRLKNKFGAFMVSQVTGFYLFHFFRSRQENGVGWNQA